MYEHVTCVEHVDICLLEIHLHIDSIACSSDLQVLGRIEIINLSIALL